MLTVFDQQLNFPYFSTRRDDPGALQKLQYWHRQYYHDDTDFHRWHLHNVDFQTSTNSHELYSIAVFVIQAMVPGINLSLPNMQSNHDCTEMKFGQENDHAPINYQYYAVRETDMHHVKLANPRAAGNLIGLYLYPCRLCEFS